MEQFLASLVSYISLVPPFLVFVATCYYLSKKADTDSILLFVGSGIVLLVSAFFIYMPRFMQIRAMSQQEAIYYYGIAGTINFLAGICFAVGLLLLIINKVNAQKQMKI
ncbi:hypothetical protein [Mucilaginibacter sp. KACC 22063]|uniref:hypothetical protein n=1 Tax=Mucilaginibacter sp. KACC 22063 TaxID=3025666 RepID=UPI0023653C0B|nr:hypothetical protein [Mucilaginibacter sp. KACC 22063]WDF53344.1 hypothetical protein PQ461_10330 [Mucilaginibacter sp. KACC 22063]